MVVVVPMAGLANRLRVIDSAINLSKEISQEVKVYWPVIHGELNCRFQHLFKDLDGIEVKTSSFFLPDTFPSYFPRSIKNRLNNYLVKDKFDYTITNKNILQINANRDVFIEQLKECEKIYIRTWERFFPPSKMDSIFSPIDSIKSTVSYYQNKFSSSYSGFHIRRNDNLWSTNKSPIHLFEKYIKGEIEMGNKVFLSTDAPDIERHFIKKFGKSIFSTKKSFTRNTIEGMQDALVDFLLLADSNIIYGSYWSSFSEEAALYKSKQLIIVKEEI